MVKEIEMIVSKVKLDLYVLETNGKAYEVHANNIFTLVFQAMIIGLQEFWEKL